MSDLHDPQIRPDPPPEGSSGNIAIFALFVLVVFLIIWAVSK